MQNKRLQKLFSKCAVPTIVINLGKFSVHSEIEIDSEIIEFLKGKAMIIH